ncbi:hypothetical protein JOQ06_002569, partial [Pogonophryne albipinna]
TSGPVKGMRCGNGWLRPMLGRTAKTLVSAPAYSSGPRGLLLKRGSVQHLQIALHNHFLLPTHSSQAALCAKAQKAQTEGFSPPRG